MMKRDAIRFYSDPYGNRGILNLAKALGITRQAVYLWGKLVPRGQAYRLQILTSGKLRVVESMYKKRKKHTRKTPRQTPGEAPGQAIAPTPADDTPRA